jgi:hypothetical protein
MIEAGKPAPVDFRTLPAMPAFDLGPEVCTVVPEYAYDAFYHDVDPRVAAECTAQLRPFARVGWDLVETSLPLAWPLYPTACRSTPCCPASSTPGGTAPPTPTR